MRPRSASRHAKPPRRSSPSPRGTKGRSASRWGTSARRRRGCTTWRPCRSCAARASAGRPPRRWRSRRSSMTAPARRSSPIHEPKPAACPRAWPGTPRASSPRCRLGRASPPSRSPSRRWSAAAPAVRSATAAWPARATTPSSPTSTRRAACARSGRACPSTSGACSTSSPAPTSQPSCRISVTARPPRPATSEAACSGRPAASRSISVGAPPSRTGSRRRSAGRTRSCSPPCGTARRRG